MSKTMKQLAIAGLVLAGVLVLTLVVVGTFGYEHYYKPIARPFLFLRTAELLEESIRNTSPFKPPTSGELTAEQWSRFCEVEAAVDKVMGPAVGVATKQRDSLIGSGGPRPGAVPLIAALTALAKIGPIYVKAKQAQIEAMNRANFSREEYLWVRRQVFDSAGLVLDELDLNGLRTAAQDKRDVVDIKTIPAEPKAAANTVLVSGRRPQLESWLALAFFDL